MRLGHPDTHCVLFNGLAYRVELVRGEGLLGHPEATLWIGRFHKKLSGPVDDALIDRAAKELLRECEAQQRLHEIEADPHCTKILAGHSHP